MFGRGIGIAATAALLLALAGCGGGGGGSGSVGAGATLTIVTASLPSGTTDAPYPVSQLVAVGADGPVSWSVAAGSLPVGLDLDTDGVLSGTPTSNGTYDFTVEAADLALTTQAELQIVITDLTLQVTSGLRYGGVWSGSPVTLTVLGGVGTIAFEAVTNASGGALSDVDGIAGTAVWTPGPTTGDADVLRATDPDTGKSADLVLDVVPNPVANHVASFGSTDVWFIEFDSKRGNHAYATDTHAALVDIGLWPETSTSAPTGEFEVLLDLVVRVQVLREINQIYLREPDGSQGAGLDISFPLERPDPASYQAPQPGSSFSGGSNRYSVMEISVGVGQSDSVLGIAFLDGGNDSHENDGGGSLGTFVDAVTDSFESWQGDLDLDDDPVTEGDTAVLEALLNGETVPGPRFEDVRDLLVAWSRAVALVAAHEIGHSLGLSHNGQSNRLMSAGIAFGDSQLGSPGAVPLTSAEVTTLQQDLPGPGRGTSALTLFQGDTWNSEVHVLYAIPPGDTPAGTPIDHHHAPHTR